MDGLTLTTRGSFPYGYGSMYGIGRGKTFGLDKHCGILLNGSRNTIDHGTNNTILLYNDSENFDSDKSLSKK